MGFSLACAARVKRLGLNTQQKEAVVGFDTGNYEWANRLPHIPKSVAETRLMRIQQVMVITLILS